MNSPCQENWNSFPKQGDAGYCSKCEHSVIDFVGKTDQEILEILNKQKGKLCGRLKRSQLRTYISRAEESFFHRAAMITAAMLTLNPLSDAVANPWNGKPGIEQTENQPIRKDESIAEKDSLTKKFRLEGRVVAQEDSSPLPGVNVVIDRRRIMNGVVTDLDGKFLIEYEGKNGEEITLVFAFIGFETMEVNARLGEKSMFEVGLIPDTMVLGGCDIGGPWWTPRSIWRSIKGVFR